MPDPLLSVTFWDVGQGDCSTIHLPDGRIIVIDTGPEGSPLIDWLNERPRKIAAVVITHNHADHVGSLPALIDRFEASIENVYLLLHWEDKKTKMSLFRRLDRATTTGKLKVRRLETGAEVWKDDRLGLSLDVVHPSILENALAPTPNHTSEILCLRSSSGVEVVWPGDATLARLANHCSGTEPYQIVGPHHGAPEDAGDLSVSPIREVGPKNAFISVATKNKYQHPRVKYIRRLEMAGCQVSCSEITFYCDRHQILEKKRPVMQSHAALGLRPPRSKNSFACRGPKRIDFVDGRFQPDELEEEHQERIQKLRRPQCLRGRAARQ